LEEEEEEEEQYKKNHIPDRKINTRNINIIIIAKDQTLR
jgi:hypothetical protein